MLKILIEAFKKSKGRMPNAIEMLQLKFKAAGQAGKGEVLRPDFGKNNPWYKDKPTTGKSAGITSINKKAQTAKTIDEDKFVADFMANADRVYYKFVNETLAKVQNASKDEQLKIAKDIINRKGMFHTLDEKDSAKILKSIDQNIKPVEPKAYGGIAGMLGERTGFKLGGIDKARRAFLKWIGVGTAGVGAAKSGLFGLLKGGGKKEVIKELTQVPIKDISGMPPWFKPLVNKVIKEGAEVPSGAERVIVHKTKLPNSKTDVYVTQELDTGNVVADIGIDKHGFADGHLGQPVRLEYKASEVIEPEISKTGKVKSKGMKTKEEFNIEEAEFSGGHPENVKFEESTLNKFGEHGSNFDEVEMFATGKIKKSKPTKKAERTEWESGKAEADADRWADEADDFASGGIARMLGE